MQKYRKMHKLFGTDKKEKKIIITYKIKFIDSARFMPSTLSSPVNPVNNLLHKNEWKDCWCHLKYATVKDNALQFISPDSKKNCKKKFGEELKK